MAGSGLSLSRVTTIQVPVSPTSAATPFQVPAALVGKPNLFFYFENMTPFDVRLTGTTQAEYAANSNTATAVTATTGWSIPARSMRGPFISKMPVYLSAMVIDTPGNPLVGGTSYTGSFIELTYLKRA